MQTLVFRIHQSIGLELGQVGLNLCQHISSEPSVEHQAWYLGTRCALAFSALLHRSLLPCPLQQVYPCSGWGRRYRDEGCIGEPM